ncbi:MAG TPA: choice-of-anchor Q domain-containing protein, partial [Mucilaginibacter sp.]
VRYNISQNDGIANSYGSITIGASAGNCNNNNIYNNTCYNNYVCADARAGNVNNNFYNNIFYCTASGTATVTAQTGAWFLNNDYYNSAGGFKFVIAGNTYTSLGALQASAWSEQWNGGNYGYNVNPTLNNPGNGGTIGNEYPNTLTNYKLNSGSPMINTGFNLATTTGFLFNVGSADFNGLSIPNGGAYDIGACEYH